MKKIYTIILIFCIAVTGHAQSVTSKRAMKAYNNMFYADAVRLYEEIVEKTGGTQEELINLADSYLKLNEYIDAELTYEKLFKLNSAQSQPIILKYAQVLAQNERYDEAQRYYSLYNEDERGKLFFEAYQNLNKFYRDSSDVKVKFLSVNSLQGEFGPAYYEKGLVFSSNRNTQNGIRKINGRNKTPFFDLYYLEDTNEVKNSEVSEALLTSIKSNMGNRKFDPDYTPETSNDNKTIGHYDPYYLPDKSTEAELINVKTFGNSINTKYHEGPVSFSTGYDTIFFTRNSFSKTKTTSGTAKVNRLKIYFATRNAKGKYEHIQEFPFNSPDYSVGHPAITPDSKRLYFVSDKEGGMGGTDIYYCEIREHRFTEPVNAGPIVNTKGSEMFPYINKDGSMYFSSNGHVGLGGLDIFRSEVTNSQFQTPRNLRFPINTSKDDFGICSSDLHGNSGYLSSNRLRGRADDNIYSFADTRPKSILVKGTIRVKQTDENGRTYIEPLQDAIITLAPLGDKVRTDRSGNYEFLVNRGKIYTLIGEKDKFGKDEKEINVVKAAEDMNTFPMDLLLDQGVSVVPYTAQILEEGSKKPLKDAYVYFFNVETGEAEKTKTDEKGNFTAGLQPNHNYILKSTSDGYFSDCIKLTSIPKSGERINVQNIELKKIQVNTTFEVKDLLYDYNKDDIREDAAKVLNNVVKFLKDYPEIEVELGSHTDSRGSDEYNQDLSSRRAQSAVNYIISQGIDKNRIIAKGYGEDLPLNRCKNDVKCSDAEHQKNRRTEVKVTGIKTSGPTTTEGLIADPKTVFKDLKDFNDCKELRVGR